MLTEKEERDLKIINGKDGRLINGSMTPKEARRIVDLVKRAAVLMDDNIKLNYKSGFNDGKLYGATEALRLAGIPKGKSAKYLCEITGLPMEPIRKAVSRYWNADHTDIPEPAGTFTPADNDSPDMFNGIRRSDELSCYALISENDGIVIFDYNDKEIGRYETFNAADKDYILF